MLGATEVTQLETWLGQGPLALTNIFTKGITGTSSSQWHGAVDNQGATFSVLEIVALNAQGQQVTEVIGGYNPYSWDTTTGYRQTPADADRTAFIFNLTTSVLQRQCLTTDPTICGGDNPSTGLYQTYNNINYGPTFGNGHDIWVNSSLSGGYSYNYAFDVSGGLPGSAHANGLDPNPNAYQWIAVGALETFTISADTTPMPAPGMLAIFGLGLAGIGYARRKRAA